MNRVWCIGGSDNSGGAGIQKDIVTVNALGCSAATVVSCITSQNQCGIAMLEPVSDASFITQIETLLAMGAPMAIKIGMLGNRSQIEILVKVLTELRTTVPAFVVVCDTVCSASAGGLEPHHQLTDLRPLLALCDLITPNTLEAEQLLNTRIDNFSAFERAGKALFAMLNPIAVSHKNTYTRILLKGGHLPASPIVRDVLVDASGVTSFESAYVNTRWNHGTGCTYASAITAAAAQHYPLEDAVVIAKACMQQALENSYTLLSEDTQHTTQTVEFGTTQPQAWPESAAYMPRLSGKNNDTQAFPPINREDFRFYAVVDSSKWVERLLYAGVKTLQLRIKDSANNDQLEREISHAIKLAKAFNAQLFINDHWLLAIKYGAYGVHLGQEDIVDANITAIHNAGLRLGISTHGYKEILTAAAIKPSYIALGHIFPTETKDMPSCPQGIHRLRQYHIWASSIAPTVAIGGIKLHNLDSVLNCNVDSVAVVTAVTESINPIATVHTFREKINAYFNQPRQRGSQPRKWFAVGTQTSRSRA